MISGTTLLWSLVAAVPALAVLYMTGLLQKALRYIYGDFTPAERNKFILFGSLFFMVIGVYWNLRCVKDAIFNSFIGSESTWQAKILSVFVVLPVVVVYSYLVDIFPRHRLFYAMSVLYAALFFGTALLLDSPTYGIAAPAETRWSFLGWMTYILIESFGSLFPALFYSFLADTTSPETGKKGFFVTATFAQLGAMIGSYIVWSQSKCWGVPFLVKLAAIATLIIIPVVAYINWSIPKEAMQGYQGQGGAAEKKATPGFTEGLRLIFSQPYLLGIFFWIFSFEAVATILDLQFKIFIARETGSSGEYAGVTGSFGVWVSAIALISLLCGVGNIGRKIGLTLSLVVMPLLMISNTVIMFVSPTLAVVYWLMVASKGINYAFGQPAKEQLFIPTTKDAKYKSKAWIDMSGSRSAKATGSGIKGITAMVTSNPVVSLALLTALSLGVCGAWFFVSFYLGRRHKHAVERNEVVC